MFEKRRPLAQKQTSVDTLPRDAERFVFILLQFLFHLNCSRWSVNIFPFPCALVGPVPHLQTLLATHMLFVCFPVGHKTTK